MRFNTVTVEGLDIFYREAGDERAPKLVLLHGFPSSSHQYRNLIPSLAERFHVVAPDYPGFGNSAAPDPREFAYTFDRLSEITEAFLTKVGFSRFGLYVQDYGGPVGFRIVTRRPDSLEWLIVQNSNAYEVGFTAAWDGLRNAYWKGKTPEVEAQLQAFLKKRQPKTVIFWGQDDIFFTREGGEAYLRDLPRAEMHRLDSGHFAVEDSAPYITEKIIAFHAREVG
jgi:pimeloyl-ACP methyl ester carboxylesterase